MDQSELSPSELSELPASWIEMTQHPEFFVAALCLARNMLRLCDEDDRLGTVFKDAGHYVAAMSAAYLHAAGGLTLRLLKQICAGSGFLSPGRAQAIIDVLLHLGYLQSEGGAGDSATYRPTELFLSAWTRHLQYALEAATMIDPSLAPLVARIEDRGEFQALLAIQAGRLHALTRGPDRFPLLEQAFLHPYAGSQILWVLSLAGPAGPTWPCGPAKLSLSELSRRFHVSHLHIRRLFRRAEEKGFIRYHGHGRLEIEPDGAHTIQLHYAFQLSELIGTGREMLARIARV